MSKPQDGEEEVGTVGMMCPFRFQEFTTNPKAMECRPDCAWLMDNACYLDSGEKIHYTCAIAVIAQEVNAHDENLFCATNHMSFEREADECTS